MNKKSVILFASFLLLLEVIFVSADLTNVSYVKSPDTVPAWTKGGEATLVNITLTANAGTTITNMTVTYDSNNYTIIFVNSAGGSLGNESVASILTVGEPTEWSCSQGVALANSATLNFSCNNTGSTFDGSAGNTTRVLMLKVTGQNGVSSEDLSINWTFTTCGGANCDSAELIGNISSFTLSNDAQTPLLYDLNVTDGSGFTIFNGTNQTDAFFYSSLTVSGTITDANLASPAYLYCSGNTTLANEGSPSLLFGAESITAVTLSGTSAYFNASIPAACIEEGNFTTIIVVANDTFNHIVELNGSDTDYLTMRINSTIRPRIALVNVSQSFVDSEGNVRTRTFTSETATEIYLGKKNATIMVELSGDDKSAINSVSFVFANESASLPFVVYEGNGVLINKNGTLTLVNLSDVNASGIGTVLFENSIDLSGDPDNTTYYFIATTNNTDNNYTTTLLGPYTFRVDASNPNEPTMTAPTDTSVTPGGTITYKCSSSDSQSGLLKMRWELTKPDSTVVKKAFADLSASAQSVTFSGTDKDISGTYTVKCIVLDAAGNEASHTSTTDEGFRVASSVTSGDGGDGGAGGGGTTISVDLDLSTADEGAFKAAQGSIKTFTFDGSTEHSITFKEVTETSVTIEISSTPVSVTLVIGETKNVDMNADGVNDLVVKLNGITDGVADVSVTKVEEGASVVDQTTPTEEQPPVEQPPAGEEVPPAEVEEGSSAWIWIVILVVLAVIVVGYFLLRKKH